MILRSDSVTKAHLLRVIVAVWIASSIVIALAPGNAMGLAVAHTVIVSVLVFWWYHLDRVEQQYRAGPLMNIAVIGFSIVALPVYFFRTRGWKTGGIMTLKALGLLVALLLCDVVIDLAARAVQA
jgi:hypothetical protein